MYDCGGRSRRQRETTCLIKANHQCKVAQPCACALYIYKYPLSVIYIGMSIFSRDQFGRDRDIYSITICTRSAWMGVGFKLFRGITGSSRAEYKSRGKNIEDSLEKRPSQTRDPHCIPLLMYQQVQNGELKCAVVLFIPMTEDLRGKTTVSIT